MEELIEELTKVRPEQLSKEGLKLFEKINEIIDKNKELDKENQALFEAYNFNDTNLLAKILKEYRMEILNSIPKSKVKEILEPTPINPIPIEIQTSSMYIKLQELLNKGE